MNRSRVASRLLASRFLLAQAGVLAHEYDHALHKHNVPCAQHSIPAASDTTVAAKALSFITTATTIVAVCLPSYLLPSQPTAAYAVRARSSPRCLAVPDPDPPGRVSARRFSRSPAVRPALKLWR